MWFQLSELMPYFLIGVVAVGGISLALIPRDGRRHPVPKNMPKEKMDPYSALWNLAAEGKLEEMASFSRKILRAARRGFIKPRLPQNALELLSEISRSRGRR